TTELGVSRRAAAVRLAAAAVMLALATGFVLLARDVWHWQRAVADADARAAVVPTGAGSWSADTVLPSGFVRGVLGSDAALRFRRAPAQARGLAAAPADSYGRQRILVEAALARIVATDRYRARASRAADYLGVLLYEDKSTPQQAISPYVPANAASAQKQRTPEEKAAAEFAAAAQLDPDNANAEHNL